MNVVTYFDPILPNQEEIVDAWQESWSRQGWTPQILGPSDARGHPSYQAYQKVVGSYPTINDPRYESACWLRWLAYSEAALEGPVVATDYDVFNRALSPVTFAGSKLLALHQVPTAACWGTKRAFDGFIVAILERAEVGIERKGGRMHLSDMTLAFKLPELWDWELYCEEWWPDALSPLVHVSAMAVDRHGSDKLTVAKSLL